VDVANVLLGQAMVTGEDDRITIDANRVASRTDLRADRAPNARGAEEGSLFSAAACFNRRMISSAPRPCG
jgi:hypothetical protein